MEAKLAQESSPKKQKLFGSDATQKLLAFASLLAMIIVFSLLSKNFFNFGNMVTITLATAVTGVLALGTTFVIITSGIDLSIGTVMTFSSVMAGVFISYWHMSPVIGVIGGIAAGGLCGYVSGILIAKMKIPPFIATLGMLNVTKGLSLIITGTRPIYFNDAPMFTKISQASVLGAIIPGFEIPNAVLIFFVLAIVASLLLTKTVLGRYTFALGSNEEATRLSGVNVDKWKIWIYIVGGLYCGIAGILMAARINSAQPALGADYNLDAIAAVVIGGTSLSGGEGSILGTFIGAFVMSVLTNGLRILSVAQEWQTVVIGLVIILAVYADIARKK
jgi:ribose transport system permease protein